MNSKRHFVGIAETVIHRMIENLLKIFARARANNEELIKLKEQRRLLDENNPDFAEINEDRRENMKLYWRVAIMGLSIGVDFLLSFQAMIILCEQYGLSRILIFLVPAFLIIVEIGISYFQTLNQRTGERSSWLVRNAQYLVLLILAGFTTLVIVYSVQSYNSQTDGGSFFSFIIGTLLWQIALFVASLMLHIWLIRNAEAIAETLAHFLYKSAWNRLTRKITHLERITQLKYKQVFVNETYKLVQKFESFKQNYPAESINFAKTMPVDLVAAINMVMGRAVFVINNSNPE